MKVPTYFHQAAIFSLAKPMADIQHIDMADPKRHHLSTCNASAGCALNYLDDAAKLLAEPASDEGDWQRKRELATQYQHMAERLANDAYEHMKCYLGQWA